MWQNITSENSHLLIPNVTIVRYRSYDGKLVEGLFKRFDDKGLYNTTWALWELSYRPKGDYVSYGYMPNKDVSFLVSSIAVDLDQDDDDCV